MNNSNMDYKPIINEMPFGFEIPGKVSSTFFRVHDIRTVDADAFRMLYRKYVSKKDPVPFVDSVDENDRFYIVPFYSHTTFRTSHIVALDKNLNFYRMGPLDPYPFNFSKVDPASKVFISPDWETYITFMESHRNVVLNYNECCIIIDKYVEINKWWVDALKLKKSISVLVSNSTNQEYVEKLLKKEAIPYTLEDSFLKKDPIPAEVIPNVKVRPKPSIVIEKPPIAKPTKKVEESKEEIKVVKKEAPIYLDRRGIVNYLADKGVKTTYDTLQKLTKRYPIPTNKEGLYHTQFVELCLKYKTTKNTYLDAVRKASKELCK